jgi:hypothetical protein
LILNKHDWYIDMISLQAQQRVANGIVLSVAADIGSRIVRRVAGNDISTSINGAPATAEVVQMLLMQRITNRLLARKNATK